MQASCFGHSTFSIHSGRQFGGAPTYVARQEHDGVPPMSRHSEYGPHGDGMHGFMYVS